MGEDWIGLGHDPIGKTGGRPMSDQEKVARQVEMAEELGELIGDGCVRVIASWWAQGYGPLQSLTTTGAIVFGIEEEMSEARMLAGDVSPEDVRYLHRLADYVERHGERGPVAGWSNLWL